ALTHRLTNLSNGSVRHILTVDSGDLPVLPAIEVQPLIDDAAAASRPGALELARAIQPWDTQAIMYTSGTTGNAKGVISSYVQLYTMGPEAFD
ncbi:AMP-binding protein, partial [Klebsiella quasipneumoniae]|uniref:AMP-binding protein n=1 Tax=Klebsiella quasipneumoniae TaxID=1463165 RepID=UPI002731DDA8